MSTSAMVRHLDQVSSQIVDRGEGVTMQILLGPDQGMPNFYTRRFVIQPQGFIHLHHHDDIEHEQFILEGELLLMLDGKEQVVHPGDSVYIPVKAPHAYRNLGSTPAVFLCMVPAVPIS